MKKSKQTLISTVLFLSLGLFACKKPLTQPTDTSSTDTSISTMDTTSEADSTTESTSEVANEAVYEIDDFFPNTDNKLYEYTGHGVEYAGFDEYTDYSSENRKQYRRPNEGTTVAEVVELQENQIVSLFHEGEIYYREDLLDKSDEVKEILLQGPFEVGHSWEIPDGRTKEITGLEVAVTTPYGEFDTLEVTTDFDNGLAHEKNYYAPDIGLVKSVYTDKGTEGEEDFEVLTELKSIEEKPYEHQISFYYPDFENDEIVVTQKTVPMKTNEETKKTIEKAYKEVPKGLTSVLSPRALMNSLYLNEDGRVYADFTFALIDEMNAGAYLEAQIIQSLVNTLGNYYGTKEVYLTVDGNPYQSGHIALQRGEFFKVKTEGSVEQ